MLRTPKYVQGAGLVLDAYGYWPSFHDARLVGVQVDGTGAGAVMLTIHAFEMTSETDERGYFRLVKHHAIRFRFDDVVDVTISRGDDSLMRLEIASELNHRS